MNNNMKFDPMTGEPIQNNNIQSIDSIDTTQQLINQNYIQPESNINVQNINTAPNESQEITNNINNIPNNTIQADNIQPQFNNIPTVEQNQQEFINNIQSIANEKKEETKKEGINYTLIITIFIIILVSIYFLFPMLLKYI